MTTHAYTEDQLVEQPAIGLFGALGWQTVSALEETFGSAAHGARTAEPGRFDRGRKPLGRVSGLAHAAAGEDGSGAAAGGEGVAP
jgi:hypothetical protein